MKPSPISRILGHLLTLSRTHVVGYVFVILAGYMLLTAAKYTIADHEYYQSLADRQQIRDQELSVNRGTIYTTQTASPIYGNPDTVDKNFESTSILATSAILKNIAIDPQQPGSKEKLKVFLMDIVYQHLCKEVSEINCYQNIQRFIKSYDPIEDFQYDQEYITKLIEPYINELVNKEYVTSRLIKEQLTDSERRAIESRRNPGLFFYDNNLYVNPETVSRGEAEIRAIGQILNMSETEISEAFSRKSIAYIPIIRKISAELREYIERRMAQEKSAVTEGIVNIEDTIYSHIILEDNPTRFYPENEMGSQIVGFLSSENKGLYGLEGYFDKQLAGISGKIKGRKDSLGRPIGSFEKENEQEVNGVDIYLTIDRNLQREIERIMRKLVIRYGSNSGSALVMDPHSGAIKAIANYPTYNPNSFGNVYTIERFRPGEYKDPVNFALGKSMFIEDPKGDKKLTFQGEVKKFIELTDPDEIEAAIGDPTKAKFVYENGIGPGAYLNNTVNTLYEPGSVFKALTVAIGIDIGEITPNTIYNDVGSLKIDEYEINNLINEKCEGYHTFRNALNFSCNVGMVRISQKIGMALMHKYLLDFGFGEKSGIGLNGEVSGKIEPFEKWSRAQLFTTSFGQGIQATMLQMAAAYSVIANGGVYMQPYIVDAKVFPNGEKIKTTPTALRRVISPETSQEVIAMLTEGTQVGFAKSGAVPGYDVAGKTGTSQIASKGVYEIGGAGHTITSFGGFAPSNNPKFVVIVRFDRPRSAQYSADTSGPAFAEVTEFLLEYYNVPKNIGAANAVQEEYDLEFKE